MKAWARTMVLAPAAAAAAAAGLAADWVAATAAAGAALLVARLVAAAGARAATAKFLAEAEGPVPDVVEVALAARVGLDLGTVIEAKAAVRAAVRQVMVRRGAGIAALVSVPRRVAADSAWAREQEAAAAPEPAPGAVAYPAAVDSEPGLSATASADPATASGPVGESDVGSERQDAV